MSCSHKQKLFMWPFPVYVEEYENWSMHSVGIVNRVYVVKKDTPPFALICKKRKKRGRKTWKWNNRNQNGFKYNTWRHYTHLYTFAERVLVVAAAAVFLPQPSGLFYTYISRFIYFTGHFFHGLPPFSCSVFFVCSFNSILNHCISCVLLVLFVWIVTFYKSWQDNFFVDATLTKWGEWKKAIQLLPSLCWYFFRSRHNETHSFHIYIYIYIYHSATKGQGYINSSQKSKSNCMFSIMWVREHSSLII